MMIFTAVFFNLMHVLFVPMIPIICSHPYLTANSTARWRPLMATRHIN